MSAPKPQGFATASIHAGYDPDSLYGAINTPIYASTTFAQNGLNELRGGYEYTRCGNPTIAALEKTVAALEGATYGRAFSSGMAATDDNHVVGFGVNHVSHVCVFCKGFRRPFVDQAV